MRSVLITGSTGFIAGHLIPFLGRRDWQITAAIRSNSALNKLHNSFLKQFPLSVTSVSIGEISSKTNWKEALNGADIVIHLAARAHILQERTSNPEAEFFKVNTEGTANLVSQSIQAGVKHFVFISSIGAMATLSEQLLTELSPCQPDSFYGRSKLQAEQALIGLASQSSMTWTILRPTLVYGPGNPGNVERLVKLVNRGLPLPFGMVNNRRSFVYVKNLVDAVAISLTHPKAINQIFLVSDGQDLSTPQLINKIAHHLGRSCHLLPVLPRLLRLAGYMGDVVQHLSQRPISINTSTLDRLLGSLFVDSSHIQTTLEWRPPYTLDQGLSQTLQP